MSITFHPVTVDRWPDLERLFSESAGEELGNPSRCWCMEWRMTDHDLWQRQATAGGDANRSEMQAFVASGEVPGILAYDGARPAGWCSISPRSMLIGLHQAGTFRHPERPDVWSIVCFYVPESQRGRGIMKALASAAAQYAFESGAAIVEGYPMAPGVEDDGAGGTVAAFAGAGFVEVARLGERQRVMRLFANSATGDN